MTYRHTQIGWAVLGAMLPGFAVLTAVAMVRRDAVPLAVLPLLALTAALMGTLTVSVDDTHVRLRMGIGLIRRTVRLTDIRGFARVRNRWFYGWGVRWFTPGGTLYSVSGLDAVQLTLADGRQLRIGSDEPDRLAAALRARLGELHATPGAVAAARRKQRLRYVALAAILIALAFAIPFVVN